MTGGTGPTGTSGPEGPMGDPGDDALVAKSGAGPIVYISDGEDVSGDPVVGGPTDVDLGDLFAGGIGDVSYTATVANADDAEVKDFIEASVSGSTLTITLKKVDAAGGMNRYDPTTGYKINVTATDSEDVKVTREGAAAITVVQNSAPTIPASGNLPDLRIGTQADKVPDGHDWPGADDPLTVSNAFVCETFDACTLKFVKLSDTTAGDAHFYDFGELEYEASVDADKAAYLDVESVKGGIKITGKMSTAKTVNNDIENRFDDEGITVSVIAVDGKDSNLKSDPQMFQVVVDAQPTSELPATLALTASRSLTLSVYFDDAEDDVAFSSDDDDANANTAARYVGAFVDDSGILMLKPGDENGSREVTIKATEVGSVTPAIGNGPIGQSVTSKITVTNNKEY
jgi:hypothetical protein